MVLFHCVCVRSVVWLFATPWTVAHQAPLSMGFSRQEYGSGLPFPPPGNLPNPGTESLYVYCIGRQYQNIIVSKPLTGDVKPLIDQNWVKVSWDEPASLFQCPNRDSFVWIGACSILQFSSVVQSCPTLCDPMNCSTPGLPVHHQLPEFTQTQVHRVGDDIQPSHPLSSPSSPAPSPSQHQSLFQWVNSSHEVAKVLEFQL